MKHLSLATALILASCAGDPALTEKPYFFSLAGSEWGGHDLADAFVQFQSNGKLSGHGGCNRFFGTYKQDGIALTIGPLGATKMMCPPPQMETETRLMGALQNTVSVDATHLVLILKDKDGKALLELQRRDWD